MSFDKEKFARLLKEAKGDRSINQYALHSGISAAHISRLMRGLLDTPPNPDTIGSLSDKAHNEITYNDLMKAAGHFGKGDHNTQTNEADSESNHLEINNKDEEDFQAFVNNPSLQKWYKELPKSPEEDLEQLRTVWEMIKKNK